MKKNMGNGDRFLRIIIGVLALILGLSGNFEGTLNWIILAVGVIMVVTSSMQFCPLYSLFGINTGKSKSEKSK
jgi:type IV secretory pathway TrbD component